MAKSLGLTIVAEGVETEAQLELLKTMGCDQIQGFFHPAITGRRFHGILSRATLI